MPHLQGVPVQSRAVDAAFRKIRMDNAKVALAGRFDRVKNSRALAATANIGLKKKNPVVQKRVVRLSNRRVPRFG